MIKITNLNRYCRNKSIAFIFICIFISCNQHNKSVSDNELLAKKEYEQPKNEVSTVVLQKDFFDKEILSNGKLVARQKSILKFRVNGNLKKLPVKNGDQVQKGQALAVLDPFKYKQALSGAELAFKKTALEFEDMLVGRGYDLTLKNEIPDNIYEMATLRSGYAETQNQLKNAKTDVAATTLRAPFSGKVASIQFKQYEQVGAGTPFMTLIDDRVFDVEFYLIESEVDQVKIGEKVEVLAFNSKKNYPGTISSINPLVEKNGMVVVKARVNNDRKLLEGLNVKVRIQKEVPGQLVVPKSAVVLRQNQEVLFKYRQGKAYWTYVETVYENSGSYSVIPNPDKSSARLTPGDTIIVSGNLNLAHDSEVVIIKK